MTKVLLPCWQHIHTIVFDFDGVFTDNKVWVDQHGNESVRCDRSDGLALDLLRGFIKDNNWNLDYFILSKEKNSVVMARAKKLQINCVQGNSDKAYFLSTYLAEKNRDPQGLVYIGNDLNDLAAMQLSGFSVAPSDAHPFIQQEASLVLKQNGGEGFVRAFIEMLLNVEELSSDQISRLF